jgi:probable phosphoglycerate mutase
MQGQLDTDLSELGRAQAVAAAEVLGKLQPLLIVSSDLRRAYDTATRLGEQTGLQIRVDARLRETHLGDWQAMTHTEIDAEMPGARLAWREDATWAPHGGESRVDVAARSVPLVAELVAQEQDWGGRPRWTDCRVVGRTAEAASGQLADPGRHGQLQLGPVERPYR